MNAAERASWDEWLADRPESVKAIGAVLNPFTLYCLKTTGQKAALESISEDGTVKCLCWRETTPVSFSVFGIDPNDLEEWTDIP